MATGSRTRSSWLLGQNSHSTSLALGFQPTLLSYCPSVEEIRLILRYCFCAVNLLSSGCGRNEVLCKACLPGPGYRCDGVQGGHPEVSVAQIFISLIKVVDFCLFPCFGKNAAQADGWPWGKLSGCRVHL